MPRLLAITALIMGLVFLARPDAPGPRASVAAESTAPVYTGPWQDFEKPAPETLVERLTPLQYRVTQESGTEAPFRNSYWDNHRDGIYVDVVSGEPLFSSRDKFASGSGWPSFTRPLVEAQVVEREDGTLGMRRVEVRSQLADSHLGHLFEDGPRPTGLRYCINSASLRFVAADDLIDQGYVQFAAAFGIEEGNAAMPENTETAILAGGCFWGMEDLLGDLPGVVDSQVGYTGGEVPDATYGDVKHGDSGHAESVRIVFDPERTSYEAILVWFFRIHDPTTMNRQGNDRGTQYRSAIFYANEAQRETAERVKAEVEASGNWKKPVVTEIVPAGAFFDAEEFHQDYLEKNPGGYTCHFVRNFD